LGEPLLWSSDALVSQQLADFRDNIIWPHIFEEEASGLHFLYFLDHLRVRKYRYPHAKREDGSAKTRCAEAVPDLVVGSG
jgi:hypothetical protein